jgi:hypothetical protein
VVCSDVAAIIYAPDCCHWPQQSVLPFNQLKGRRNLEYQRLPNLWRSCFHCVHQQRHWSTIWALLLRFCQPSLVSISGQWQLDSSLWV